MDQFHKFQNKCINTWMMKAVCFLILFSILGEYGFTNLITLQNFIYFSVSLFYYFYSGTDIRR